MNDGQFRQWSFIADMNASGSVTISDTWLWVKWLFYYSGDFSLYLVIEYLPEVSKFMEISLS